MKKTILILAALAGALTWTSCQKELPEPETVSPKPDNTVTMTLKASKAQPGTKALDLSSDGTTLNVYWKNTEIVKVYKGGACIGTLNVKPGTGEKPLDATLSGDINKEGIATGDKLMLLIPREVWDYTGQTGTLTGDNSIESLFDYSVATVTVSDVTSTTITASEATFENQQSIYRISFKTGNNPLAIKGFNVYAEGNSNQLVKTRTYANGEWTSTTAGAYGVLEMTLPSVTSDPFYMAIRNENSSGNDVYTFQVYDSDGTLYIGSKSGIPYAYYTPGHFISMRNISVSKYIIPDKNGDATTVY